MNICQNYLRILIALSLFTFCQSLIAEITIYPQGNEVIESLNSIDSKSPLPIILGLPEKNILNHDLVLKAAEDQGIIHYELSKNSGIAPSINDNSPKLLETGLTLPSLENEKLVYSLRLRHSREGEQPSDELLFEFVIDRQKPAPPNLDGYSALHYSIDDIELEPITNDTKFWYKLDFFDYSVNEKIPNIDAISREQEGKYQLLTERKLGLSSPLKGSRIYRLKAYNTNEAGTQSEIVTWTFVIESDTVYVVDDINLNGKLQNGSRTYPFNNLMTAIKFAEEKNKSEIKLSSGNFIISNEQKIRSKLIFSGSNKVNSWEPDPTNLTIIYPSINFIGESLFALDYGNIECFNIYLTDSGRQLNSLIRLEYSTLFLTDSSVATSKAKSAINAFQSTLTINSSVVSCNDPLSSVLIDIVESKLTLNSSIVESADLPSLLLKQSGKAEYTLISAKDSSIQSQSSKVVARNGKSTINIVLDKSSLNARDSSFFGGQGSDLSITLDAYNESKIFIYSCQIHSNRLAKSSVNVRLYNSIYESTNSTMLINASLLAYGFIANKSQVQSNNSNYTLEFAQDFLALISIDDGSISFSGSEISAIETGDLQLVMLRQSQSNWTQNRISFVNSIKRAIAFNILGDKHSYFENNHLSASRDSTLFNIASEQFWITMNRNLIEGWSYLLTQHVSREALSITTLQDLEKLEFGKSKFVGNRVQVGL